LRRSRRASLIAEKKLAEKRISVKNILDVSKTILESRAISKSIGFKPNEQCMISTAVSELGTNIVRYAGEGEIILRPIVQKGKKGIEVVAEDNGPGIKDINLALKENYSTSKGLGVGLPGIKRLMHEFLIDPSRTKGTKITVRRWL